MTITVDSLMSGLIGAIVGSGLAVLYQHISVAMQRRFDVMLLAVDYLDDLYFQSRHIQQYKEKKYKENRDAFSTERYMELCDKTDYMLTSSRVHARVAMTYGENSQELDSFNKLRAKLTDAALMLFRAKAETWDDTSKKVMELFEKEIDPLRQNTEIALIRSTKLMAVLRGMVGLNNGWQLIGVVLSALWCLVIAGLAYQYAGFIDPDDLPLLYHFSEFLGLPYLGVIHKVVVIILAGTMPIVGAWLLVYGMLWTARWVAAGFKP